MKREKYLRSHTLVDGFDEMMGLYKNRLKELEEECGVKDGRIGYLFSMGKVHPCIYFVQGTTLDSIVSAQSFSGGKLHVSTRLHFISDDIFEDLYSYFEDAEEAYLKAKSGMGVTGGVEYDGEVYPILLHYALCMTIPDIDK